MESQSVMRAAPIHSFQRSCLRHAGWLKRWARRDPEERMYRFVISIEGA